jgi:hypothetical protein
MKRSQNNTIQFKLLIAPCFLFMVMVFLFSRVSAQIPDQGFELRPGAVLAAAAVSALPEAAASPARPARWFRSNAGGMALQETSTRFAALSNEYALLIDSAARRDLPQMLAPYYREQYVIEVHVLYHNGTESRRQWIFRDGKGVTRMVSVLNQRREEPAKTPPPETGDSASNSDAPTGRAPWGFIEVYNENYRITGERMFSEDGEENSIEYAYRGGLLIKAEGQRKTSAEGSEALAKTFTDDYRYNRSQSLRLVERIYHGDAEAVPVRLTFPNRVLDLAKEDEFTGEKLAWNSEFFGELEVMPGYRMVFTTDERGRILTQSLLDDTDTVVWVITNTWLENRLVSALKTEGDDLRLVEYEYNSAGERILERNVHNGVLERLVRAEGGGRDIEELYMHGAVILRAVWEDGRKVSEQRIRSGQEG